MRITTFFVWTTVLFTIANCQYSSSRQQSANQQQGNGNSWDIRLAVPGEPGSDYPTLGGIPKTSFSCAGKKPGYYADLETSCQVFRICTSGSTYGFQSFLCPNGTLFNQQVFVCDWWMNVNCQESQKYFVMNNDKYGSLKLGPHMMSDIKNMLTHPTRNPYDKGTIKNNYVVMQVYKPPSGQLFPNGALRAGYERALSNNYVPAKIQTNYNNAVSASSPSPQYVPATFNNRQNGDIETFQRQTKSGRLAQSDQPQNQVTNGHTGRITQSNGGSSQTKQNYRQNYQNQYQNKLANDQAYSTQNTFINQGNQLNAQYRDNKISQASGVKQAEFGISFKKEQFTYPTQQSTTGTIEHTGKINEATQNLVSSDVPSTVITKTLTLDRHVKGSNQPNPTSRLTFKSWIVKPSKNARLIAESGPYAYNKPANSLPSPQLARISEPTPYVYNKPTSPPLPPQPARIISEQTPYVYNKPTNAPPPQPARIISEPTPYVYNKPTNPPPPPPPKPARIVSEPTPYVYNKPTNPPQIARIVSKATPYVYNKPTNPPQIARLEAEPYYYNKPTQAAKLVSESGYVYNRPPVAAKIVVTTESPRLYLAPTTRRPTAPLKLYLPPTTSRPTLSGRLYLAPTTSRPTFARQRIAPNAIVQPVFQSVDQEVSPTSPTPFYLTPQGSEVRKPSFTFTKHSRINANHNNLTFTDILTKEKLDITVHDIVKDTSNVLNSPNSQLGELRQAPKDEDYPEEAYLPPENSSDGHVETISDKEEINTGKSGNLIAAPSTDLEPPNESFENINNEQNPIAKLPFYKEASSLPANTIERTVSLKISIPEKTAAYLFKQKNESDYDRLEILNTGSSNYLVLTNNNINKLSQPNFIPIGQLVIDKNSNVSNSQALVYSFLADSLNVAKEYNNIVDQNIQSQQYNNEDLSQISDKISQLTSTQYSQDNTANNRGQINYSNSITQNQAQINQQSSTNTFSSGFTQNINRQTNDKQIYSGQLYQVPVPEVANQIYNEQVNFAALNKNSEHKDLQQSERELHHSNQQSSAEVEIVKSHSLTLPSVAAKLRGKTSTSAQSQEDETAHEIFRNLINGDGITAQLRDKIIGSISHPYEDKKLVTYKKDQSYYLFTKLDENIQNEINANLNRNGKLVQDNGNAVTLQFIPSVSFQVDDEKEQQRLLNAFQLNEYGVPKVTDGNRNLVANDVNYSISHPVPSQSGQYRHPETLYTGPSSYSAPQATVGRLETQKPGKVTAQNNNFLPARLEDFNENTGYAKVAPSRQFTF